MNRNQEFTPALRWVLDSEEGSIQRHIGPRVEIPAMTPVDIHIHDSIISPEEAQEYCRRQREKIQERIRTMPDILP